MNRQLENIPAVLPPALDTEETELAARNEYLAQNFDLNDDFETAEITEDGEGTQLLDEAEEAAVLDEETEKKMARRGKFRKSLMFLAIFCSAIVIFVVFISWAYGFGLFAAPSRITVDRNQKTGGNNTPGNTSNEEKLKTALSIVADEAGGKQNSAVISDSSTNPNANPDESLSLPPKDSETKRTNDSSSGNMIVLPNENSNGQTNIRQNQTRIPQIDAPAKLSQNSPPSDLQRTNQNLLTRTENKVENRADKSDGTVGRSVFFGRLPNQNESIRTNASQIETGQSQVNFPIESAADNLPPFGTLLPVRFLGAVFTLTGSGGLIRMELSRSVQGKNFSYPAGTVLVGRLRGSETNRAFISVFGIIDPKSGKIIKIEGDVMGSEGASGVVGERKSVKTWGTKFLNALREVGGQTVNILSSRSGRGGTVLLSGNSGVLGEASSIIRGNANNDSFVVVKAGTDAYVLITDLPDEQRELINEKSSESQTNNSGLNLSETEMAELLTTSDLNKIRAALLKMSPKERALAINSMEDGK